MGLDLSGNGSSQTMYVRQNSLGADWKPLQSNMLGLHACREASNSNTETAQKGGNAELMMKQ